MLVRPSCVEPFVGEPVQLVMRLDGVDVARKPGQDRRLIAGPGAYFQNLIIRREVKPLGHEGDDEGLGYRLLAFDGQRFVGVGVLFERAIRYEHFPRGASHGFEHPGIGNPVTLKANQKLLQRLISHRTCPGAALLWRRAASCYGNRSSDSFRHVSVCVRLR